MLPHNTSGLVSPALLVAPIVRRGGERADRAHGCRAGIAWQEAEQDERRQRRRDGAEKVAPLGVDRAAGAVGVVCGLPWQMALAVGLIVAMSSTAIALQTLAEKGWLKTPGGEASFAVLLFQDISVIPILALLPLLATGPRLAGQSGDGG